MTKPTALPADLRERLENYAQAGMTDMIRAHWLGRLEVQHDLFVGDVLAVLTMPAPDALRGIELMAKAEEKRHLAERAEFAECLATATAVTKRRAGAR